MSRTKKKSIFRACINAHYRCRHLRGLLIEKKKSINKQKLRTGSNYNKCLVVVVRYIYAIKKDNPE